MVDLLAYARKQPWGKTFLAALARPGQGTLKAWPSLASVAAKTGTLRHTLALVGYLEPESDEPVLFAYLFRAKAENRAPLRGWVGRQLQQWAPAKRANR
jgi:D-alanyl-D-alanine carboxypeptidase